MRITPKQYGGVYNGFARTATLSKRAGIHTGQQIPLKAKIKAGGAQFFDNEAFVDNPAETPRTLAAKSVKESAPSTGEAARRFKVHKSTMKRIANRHRARPQTDTERAPQTDTERNKSDTERAPVKVLNKSL